MYYTDRGIEELDERRGDEQVTLAWLAQRLRDFVDLNPDFETAVDRLATWLARLDDEEDLLSERAVARATPARLPARGWLRPSESTRAACGECGWWAWAVGQMWRKEVEWCAPGGGGRTVPPGRRRRMRTGADGRAPVVACAARGRAVARVAYVRPRSPRPGLSGTRSNDSNVPSLPL
jgi:hypothetical protein